MFPPLYSAHHSRYTEDLPFWLGLAARQGEPILELGCGTGRVLIPLAQAGYLAVGLDNDLEMLRFLRLRLEACLQPQPLLFATEMSAFHLQRRFALILSPCNTWSTLDASQRRVTLQRIVEHLLPGGLLAFSVPAPDLLMSLPARSEAEIEEIYQHPQDGNPVQVSSGWRRTKGHFIVTWHYDHLLEDGRVERMVATVRHELTPVQGYIDEICAAGMKVEAVYGDYDGSPYTVEAQNLILTAGW